MKWNVIALACFLSAAMAPVKACIDPLSPYAAGVVFSGNELIVPENIERYCADTLAYIKKCPETSSGQMGKMAAGDYMHLQEIVTGAVDALPSDPLEILSVGIIRNILRIDVRYGGGCKEHDIQLHTDGKLYITEPATLDLYLSHDARGESCEALVSGTLYFDLSSLAADQARLQVFAPGVSQAFTDAPLWTRVPEGITGCSYTMRSAYSDKVMACIGPYSGMFDDPGDSLMQLLVVFDTSSVPTTEEKAAAVRAELLRLMDMGVLSIGGTRLAAITAALSGLQGQYWTREDTVLQFNQWSDGSSVNGVLGVYSAKGCALGVEYRLPERSIIGTAVSGTLRTATVPVRSDVTAAAANGMVTLRFAPVSGNGSLLRMTDLRGRVVVSLPLAAHDARVEITGKYASSGCYMITVMDQGRVVQSGVVSVSKK